MADNPQSSLHLVTTAPTSELIGILRRLSGLPDVGLTIQESSGLENTYQSSPAYAISSTLNPSHRPAQNGWALQANLPPSTQLKLLESLILVCRSLANGTNINNIINREVLLMWIGAKANIPALVTFLGTLPRR
ncbi:hypothetical protein F5Y16DRAFT_210610 [Xylariaceae sp. FL0255]|nr:hypothetical protein F5Y16DRAFT_210610 [Xylariaceae sp. FL0255]